TFAAPRAGDESLNKLLAQRVKKSPKRVTQEALDCLLAYPWPGNVRELENVIERAMVVSSGDEISVESLPVQIASGLPREPLRGKPFHDAVREFKRWMIRNALKQSQGNQTRAAELLGLQRTYLAKLVRLLEVKPGRAPEQEGH
ncbi:MAG: hypothetical protein L0312_09855, partial [Acidobacteria bacterium]|nr:hypothetical protein [Acidobacteriota bacterium]